MTDVIDLVTDDEESVVVLDNNNAVAPIPQEFFFARSGKPLVWRRHVVYHGWNRAGNFWRRGVNPNSPETAVFRDFITSCLLMQYGVSANSFPIFGTMAVYLELVFYRPLPLKFFVGGNRNNALKEGAVLASQNKRPDVDNMTKFILDGLEGIFYDNDSRVAKVVATKCNDLDPPYEGSTTILVRSFRPSDLPHVQQRLLN